jgi:hypothetical protein
VSLLVTTGKVVLADLVFWFRQRSRIFGLPTQGHPVAGKVSPVDQPHPAIAAAPDHGTQTAKLEFASPEDLDELAVVLRSLVSDAIRLGVVLRFEVVPHLVELEVAVPRLTPTVR